MDALHRAEQPAHTDQSRSAADSASLRLQEASYHGLSAGSTAGTSADKPPSLSHLTIVDGSAIVAGGEKGNRIIADQQNGPNSRLLQETDSQGNTITIDRLSATKASPNSAVFTEIRHRDGSASLAYTVTEPGGRVFPSVDLRHVDGTNTNVEFDGRTGRPKTVTDEATHSIVDFDTRTGQPSQVTIQERDGHARHFRIDPISHKAEAEPLLDFAAIPRAK